MAWVNLQGYIERGRGKAHMGRRKKNAPSQNWWLIKSSRADARAQLDLSITFPARYYGKRIRLKVEEIEDGG